MPRQAQHRQATKENDDGILTLVERNCPFQNVAMERPKLCSTTVSTLSRLLGVRVERVKTFQGGDGMCAFRVHSDEDIDSDFRFAFEPNGNKPD